MFDVPFRRCLILCFCVLLPSAPAAGQDGTALRTTVFRGAEIAYEVIDGLAVYAGDIILGTAAEVAAWNRENVEPTSTNQGASGSVRNVVPSGYRQDSSFCIWPDGIIPYVIDHDMTTHNREAVLGAIRIWDDKTVLRFVERGPHHANYLRFSMNPVGGMWICRDGGLGEQVVHVEPVDGVGNLLHVVGHAIGLEHENMRRDRDHYLTVSSENIAATPLAQLAWHPKVGYGPDIGPYDYRSIMHYRFVEPLKQRNHARPRAAETIPPGMPFGAADEVSPGDVDSVARLYGRIPAEHVISTNPSGLEITVDGVRMTAPVSFRWAPDSEHTLEVPSPQFGDGARYLFGRWSDDGARVHTIRATRDTTLYQASFVAQHQLSTKFSVWCWTPTCSSEDGHYGNGTFTLTPTNPDGYYTLRTPIEIAAVPPPGSALKFLWWDDPKLYREPVHTGDQAAAKLMNEVIIGQSNPARTFVLPGVTHEAIFTADAPVFRVQSNVNPVPVVVGDFRGFTPINFLASDDRRFADPTTVKADLIESIGRAYRHRFRSWSNGGDQEHTIEVPQDRDSTLTLTLDTDYRLTTRAWQDWHGNEVLTTPSSEDGFYPEGTQVRLRAVAKPPAKFIGWNGDVAGRDPAATMVMDDGKLAEAVFALDATELRSGVPVEVSLHSEGDGLDFERFYVQVPADANAVEIRFDTRTATPETEAGLFLSHTSDLRGERVYQKDWATSYRLHHDNADRVLREGAVTLTIPSPPTIPRLANWWPAAYFILVRAAESDDAGTRILEGTLVATVTRGANRNRPPQAVGTLDDPTLTVGHGALVVDVARAFSDPDGDVLTYTATSAAQAIAAVAVSGDTATVTPVRPGVATVTVTATDPGGLSAVQRFAVTVVTPGIFTDHPLRPGTPIRAVHFRELRERIAALAVRVGLPVVEWTDPILVAGATPVRRIHLTELRSALDTVFNAVGGPRPAYTDAVVAAGVTPIKAAHIMELRNAIAALEPRVGSVP